MCARMLAYTGNWNIPCTHADSSYHSSVGLATDKSTTIVVPAAATLEIISKLGLNTSSGSEWARRRDIYASETVYPHRKVVLHVHHIIWACMYVTTVHISLLPSICIERL